MRPLRVAVATMTLAVVAGCGGTAPAPAGTPVASGAAGPSITGSLAPGKATVSANGTTTHVEGLGNATSAKFDLPAGDVAMAVSTCSSNGVIPFVWVYDAGSNMVGIVTEQTYLLPHLKGGAYYLTVAANPDCGWAVEMAAKP